MYNVCFCERDHSSQHPKGDAIMHLEKFNDLSKMGITTINEKGMAECLNIEGKLLQLRH